MYTSCLLIALAGLTAPAQGSDAPNIWLTDYWQARKQVAAEKKPLAVVVASGKDGWTKVAKTGSLGKESQELLANYVCVYVDTNTEDGKRLARQFDLPGRLGIVISDHGGQLMAFHHEGNLDQDSLNRYLRKYGDSNRQVTKTDTNPSTERRSYYAPATTPSINCSSCRR